MALEKLQCDICGGTLEMQSGGNKCICSNCGMTYATERVKEIYAGMKVSVTGSEEDVEQWRILLDKYLKNFDYNAAEGIIKKILEAKPYDERANMQYDTIQSLKYYDIRNKVLVKYNGPANTLLIPDGVTEIVDNFAYNSGITKTLEKIEFPNSIIKIGSGAFSSCIKLKEVCMSENIKWIGDGTFSECSELVKINISKNCVHIGGAVFRGCSSLKEIHWPSEMEYISSNAFERCRSLNTVVVGQDVKIIRRKAFKGCASLANINIPYNMKNIEEEAFWNCKILRERWVKEKICPKCGGNIKGWWTAKCDKCGQEHKTINEYDNIFGGDV